MVLQIRFKHIMIMLQLKQIKTFKGNCIETKLPLKALKPLRAVMLVIIYGYKTYINVAALIHS